MAFYIHSVPDAVHASFASYGFPLFWQVNNCRWPWRRGNTRSHSEHGSQALLRRWYCLRGGKVGSCRLFFRAVSSAGTSVWFTPRMSGVRSSHCPYRALCCIRGLWYFKVFRMRNSRHSVRPHSLPLIRSPSAVNPKKLLGAVFLNGFPILGVSGVRSSHCPH